MQIKDYSREFLITIYIQQLLCMVKILPYVYSYYLYFVINQEIRYFLNYHLFLSDLFLKIFN